MQWKQDGKLAKGEERKMREYFWLIQFSQFGDFHEMRGLFHEEEANLPSYEREESKRRVEPGKRWWNGL